MAEATAAATTDVSGTDAFGAAIGKVFSDPNVQAGISNTFGAALNNLLGAPTGPTPDQIAAQKAAQDAQTRTMLIVGGAVLLIVIVGGFALYHATK